MNNPQKTLSISGGLNIDQANQNEGTLTNSGKGLYSLTFGSGSGEGLASQRTGTGNVNGLDFYTGYNKRMCIANGGNVGIGTTSPSVKLEVSGAIKCTSLTQTSDARYKKNIETVTNALQTVEKLRGVSFDWRNDEYPGMNFGDAKQLGFVAQEVEKILPEVVSKDDEGSRSVAYSSVVPVLVEAIKEQQKTIDDLKAKLSEMDQMKARLAALEAKAK